MARRPRPSAKSPLTFAALEAFALSFGLPRIEKTTSWGQPTLKAHGKLWVWWSAHENAPVFKVESFDERDMLIDMDPETFFFTDHYRNHKLVLARPDRIDMDWAEENLRRTWRAMAPKRFLKDYDAGMTMT
ncbi:MAG: hypothetical protein GC152_09255 [Alphaproteobacteria bacterium]|nr:hypothetical protein [Alphaproteobacteria bacterium]